MKKFTYCILIFFVFSCLCFLIFQKDYGFDIEQEIDYLPFKGLSKEYKSPVNKTIGGVDYLESQLPVGKFGGVYKTSILGEPSTFNPYNAKDATSAEISELMYDGLTTTDFSSGKVIPKLAKSVQILPDNKTYIVKMRRGVKWSDGKEITAFDAFFTYNTVIFGGFGDGSIRDTMLINGKLPKVELIDKYTLKFITPQPFAPFLRNLSASILPKHIFEPVTKKGNEFFLTFQGIDVKPDKLVVSGPYRLSEYLPAQRVVLKKNANYYLLNKLNQKLPYLDKIVMLIVGDINNQTLKFESGELDMLSVNGSLVNRYRELQKHGNFDLYNLGATTNTTFLVFNLNNRKNKDGKYYVSPIKQKWFQNANFRRAIDWAIDRDDIVINIFSAMASPLYTAEPINSLFLNEKIAKGHPKNVEYAKSLLADSGFKLKNGVLFDKDNNKVEFELLTNAGNTQREAVGVSIKQDLEKLGIKVNFKPVEFNSLVNKLTDSVDYDCVIMGLTSNINEPNSGYSVWVPNGALHLFNKRTRNDLKDTDVILPFEVELEEIFKKGALELDFAKRKLIYDKYQEVVAKNNPMIYLYAPLNIVAIRKNIKNIFPTKIGGLTGNICEIYLDK